MTLNAKEVLEAYVAEVASRLPRRRRNDVAFELKALLEEELQGKAESAGRPADAELAMELLRAFGRPAEVAARYRPALTVIDPADGWSFVRASAVGLAILWVAKLMTLPWGSVGSGGELLGLLGRFWTETLVASFWWPGVLVVGYGLAAWSRRRRPQSAEWRPRPADRLQGGRAATALGIVGILCGTALLIEPRWFLDLFFGGRAAPAAYEALTYTDAFRDRHAPLLLTLLLLNVPLLAAAMIQGRWTPRLRRLEAGLSVATCAVLVWSVLAGPVMRTAASDLMMRLGMALTVLFVAIHAAVTFFRSVRPAPSR